MKKKRFALSTVQIIMLGFLATILIGSLLLALPISSATGEPIPYVDALFTATTATCVTGLVTVTTCSAWSTFGHIVILALIQIGGLGVITVASGIMIALNKRLGLGDRLLIQDAFNLNTLEGLIKFVKKVIIGTLIVEGIGALLYMTVFVPQFGAKGIWYSIFNSVSAFCNAGIDIISPNSLSDYVCNPMINFVTCTLIVVAGIGYIVWWDVVKAFRNVRKMGVRAFKALTLHSKIALTTTAVLIFGGALLVFLFEYNNPNTIGNLSLYNKIQASFFQSVTTRTAGFFTIPQQELTSGSVMVSILLMFIGGSPVGTAGGVKTVTIAVLLLSAFCTIKNKRDVSAFNRTIPPYAINKTVSVVCVFLIIVLTSTFLVAATTDASALDVVYETVSAAATVGLTRNLTPFLSTLGKLIITATMYLGRVGPISLFFAFSTKKERQNIIKNPTEDISVG